MILDERFYDPDTFKRIDTEAVVDDQDANLGFSFSTQGETFDMVLAPDLENRERSIARAAQIDAESELLEFDTEHDPALEPAPEPTPEAPMPPIDRSDEPMQFIEDEAEQDPFAPREGESVADAILRKVDAMKAKRKAEAEAEAKSQRSKNELIDSFIQIADQIQPIRPGQAPEPELAPSIEEKDNLVTERYAALLAQQGHHEKAIRAYEQLGLKFPEKNAYFAAQIDAIRQQMDRQAEG